MKYFILYNPISGNGKGGAELDKVKALIDAEYEVYDVTQIKDYNELIAKLGPDDALVLSGGDGTINRFVNNIDGVDLHNTVYYYASGTGNDFLHDIEGAKEGELLRLNEYLKDLPIVTVNGKDYRFINGVGFGIDGYCCEEGDKLRGKSDKPVNYTAIAIKGLLFHFKPVTATVNVDGKDYVYKKVWIAPTMNGRLYGGGMMPTPAQDRLNKERDVSLMLFYGTGKIKTLMIFPSLFKGEHVKHTEAIAIHKGKEITVKFDRPTALQIDGETFVNVTEYKVRSAALETAKV